MPDATAMAVRDGTVVWLGSDDVGLAQFPDAEVVDLDGGFVAPAFVDSHVHLTATGLMLAGLDLRAATSARHCLQLVAEYAQSTSRRADLGARLGRVGLAGADAAEHRRPGRRGRRPAGLPGPRRRPFGGGVHGTAAARARACRRRRASTRSAR